MKFSITALALSLLPLATSAPVEGDERLGLRIVAPGTNLDGAGIGRKYITGYEDALTWDQYPTVGYHPSNITNTYIFHNKVESTLYSVVGEDPLFLSLDDNVLVFTNNTEASTKTKIDVSFIDDILTINGESQQLAACLNLLDDVDEYFLTYQLPSAPDSCVPCKVRRGYN